MAILLDMTRAHVPGPRRRADRPDRPGARARRRSTARSAPAATRAWWPTGSARPGTLVCIDRDPAAEERFEELAAEVACETRFLRMDYADGLALLRRGGLRGRRRLPRPRHLLDAGRRARARLLLLLRRAARHAHGPEPGARRARGRERAGTSASWRRSSAATARSPTRAGSRARSCGAGGARRSRRPASWSRRSRPRCRPPCGAASAAGTPPSASSRRSGSRSTTSSTRSTARCRLAWDAAAPRRPAGGDLLPLARGPAREALPRRARARLHLPARLPGLRLRPRARGRAAHPPRRGADARRGRPNPRSKSGRLRAARRIEPGARADGPRRRCRAAPRRRRRRRPPLRRAARPPRPGAASRRPAPRAGPARAGTRQRTRARAALRARRAARRVLDALLHGRGWIGARRRAARRDRVLQRRPARR